VPERTSIIGFRMEDKVIEDVGFGVNSKRGVVYSNGNN